MGNISEMELRKAKRAIKTIAQQNGVSEAQVRADMEEAIVAAYNSPDPGAQAEWAKAPFAGRVPTVEEFIMWMSSRVKLEQ
jgi:hypothetical protein